MKIAKIENSRSGAYLQSDGSYLFGPALNRQFGKQCGGSTNDWLGFTPGEKEWMSHSPKSKTDSPDYGTIEEGGKPFNGGYFVMDIGPYWHVGVINNVAEGGIYITDYNRNNRERRRENYFIKEGTSEWKKIHGFGVGNFLVEYSPEVKLDVLVENSIIPQNSALWYQIEDLRIMNRLPEKQATICKKLYEQINDTLRGK